MIREKLVKFIQGTLLISAEKANLLAEKFEESDVPKNHFILKEGEVCNTYCFLQEGFMRSFTYDQEGNDITTGFYSKNMFVLDYVSLYKRTPSKENIQALTACKLWCISYDDLQIYYHSVHEFREFGRLLLVNNFSILKQKVFSLLHETAEQRYANLIKSNPAIFQHTSLKNIASYLGITDTSLSRIRKELTRK
jgi:CRP-like cAMP-binding protein